MREFDYEGMILAKYQGMLFEKSVELNCSTPIFMRRFLHSDLLRTLDENLSYLLSLDVNDGLDSINEQFGDSNYGTIKLSSKSLFWIGYMYRYISYTREVNTRFIMKFFDYNLMNDVYLTFHTQDPEWCIASLLDIKGLNEDIFDKNKRLKKLIEKKYA